jgi:thymidylate kinase
VNGRPLVVGIEGPCCAGKTTLSRGLMEHLSTTMTIGPVRDYADWVGGGRFLPAPQPESVDGEDAALRELLHIEADRTAAVRAEFHRLDLVLVDRSVHTLAAHCAGLTRLTGVDYSAAATRVLATASTALWPDLLLYLDVDRTTVATRNNGKFPPDSLFINDRFNAGIRQYFAGLTGVSQPRVGWFDGGSGARLLCRRATAYLTESLPIRADEGRL